VIIIVFVMLTLYFIVIAVFSAGRGISNPVLGTPLSVTQRVLCVACVITLLASILLQAWLFALAQSHDMGSEFVTRVHQWTFISFVMWSVGSCALGMLIPMSLLHPIALLCGRYK